MKILVTGANGYLGQGIVKQLLDDGITVVAADYSLEKVDNRAIKKSGDMFSIEKPYDYYEFPDVVLHLAWRNGFIHNSSTHLDDLPKHYAFLKELAVSGIKRIAVMGTMHEIGFYEGSINEKTPCNPSSMYGIAKNALRNAVFLICQDAGIPAQWLRGFYMVGNVNNGSSIFSKIADAERKGLKLFPFTSGQNQWDFIDYGDFCFQAASAVEQEDVVGVINLCSGHPQKLCDRVEAFLKDNNYKIKLDYGKYLDRPYDSKAVWGDNTKIQAIIENRMNQVKKSGK